MKLQVFDGGAANRLEPQLINQNQGVVYENINNARGVLTPEKDKTQTDIVVTQHHKYYRAAKEWLSSATTTDFLEFQKVMYLTNRSTVQQKYSDGQYDNLGIVGPVTKPGLTSLSTAQLIDGITAVNNISDGDLPGSDLDYMLVNVKDGIYSLPFVFTIFSSNTTITRSDGEFVDTFVNGVPVTGSKLRRLVNNIATPEKRSIDFSDLKGSVADSILLFRKYNGEWRLLHTFATLTGTFSDTVEDITANDLLDEEKFTAFNGTYQYVYTYYNSADGTESIPSPISAELELTSGVINVTLPSNSSDSQVTNKRLYRIGRNIASFTMVVELPASDTSYTDGLRDTELDGRLLESDNYYEAPDNLSFLSESYAMLFGAVDSTLRFTPIGKPNAWPPEYSIQFDDTITGLGPVATGLLVFTQTRAFIITGTGPLSLAQQPLRGDQGCIAFESIQQMAEGGLVWASKDGLCASSGNNVVSLTKHTLGAVILDPVDSVVLNEVYYCHNSDGTTLAWDYRFKPIPKWLKLGITQIAKAEAELYGWIDGVMYTLFTAANSLTFKYKSPRFVEGSFTENKTYKKVYIRSDGDIIINIIIDGVQVASKVLSGSDSFDPQVPQDAQRGFSIEFEVEGTGTVHEIEYKVGKRKDG